MMTRTKTIIIISSESSTEDECSDNEQASKDVQKGTWFHCKCSLLMSSVYIYHSPQAVLKQVRR